MSLSRVHNWIPLETLTASDLNAEYNNILNYLNSGSVTLGGSLSVTGSVGIGMTPVNILDITQNQNGDSISALLNSSAGGSARAIGKLLNGTHGLSGIMYGASFTTSGFQRQDGGALVTDGAGGLSLGTLVNQPVYVIVNNTEVGRWTSTGLNSAAIGATTPGTGAFTTLTASTPMGPVSGGKPSNRLYSGVALIPTATTSATYVMMGMGSTLTLTPTTTGAVRIRVQGHADMATDTQSVQMKLYYGTGTAPVNGAAFTGTAFSATGITASPGATGGGVPFSIEYEVTGLTLSAAYWFDMAILSSAGGSASVQVVGYRIEEF